MRSVLSILALAGIAVVLGCKGTYLARYDPNPKQESEKVILLDSKLKSIRIVREVPPQRLNGQQLQIQVLLVNTDDEDLRTDVKVQFLDVDGGILEEGTWEPVIFQRSMERSIKKNSISPEAADYRISIRRLE